MRKWLMGPVMVAGLVGAGVGVGFSALSAFAVTNTAAEKRAETFRQLELFAEIVAKAQSNYVTEFVRMSLRATPFFSGPAVGVGMLSAVLILAIMVIPFASSVAREVLKAVPGSQREAAYARGATRGEAIRAALFYARTGIIGSLILGFGRALGETMAVTMVIGNNPQIKLSLLEPQYTMSAVLANEFAEAADNLYLSALIEIGLVLFVITLMVNMASRLLIWQMNRPVRAARPARIPTAAAAAGGAA